jgi:hypothetical protein
MPYHLPAELSTLIAKGTPKTPRQFCKGKVNKEGENSENAAVGVPSPADSMPCLVQTVDRMTCKQHVTSRARRLLAVSCRVPQIASIV